jgi:hypothetical protein
VRGHIMQTPLSGGRSGGTPQFGPDESAGQETEPVSFLKAAFTWQYNLIALGGACAFALVSRSLLPMILASGLELIYLSVIPHNKQFQRLVRSWQYAEEKRRHEMKLTAMFQELPSELRLRYANLDKVCSGVRANYNKLSSTSQIFASQMEDKLQGLLQAYLRLLVATNQHREYLRTTDPEAIRRDVTQLQKKLESDSPKVQEINQKRVEILTKRLEKYDKIRENRQVIEAQCSAIEDVLQLIRDQSVTMKDPQQLSGQLEDLVHDVEQTEETVRQVEAIFETTVPEAAESLAPLPTSSRDSDSKPVPGLRDGRIRN